ncbi:MAG: hypothetical protein F6K11_06185 [Leptolyngbya sp. SIO3F4]|nr:hypothetical protein [Leptolyngbya sp. SIO3F4]
MKRFFGLLMAIALVFGTLVSDVQPALAGMLNNGTVILAASCPATQLMTSLVQSTGTSLM